MAGLPLLTLFRGSVGGGGGRSRTFNAKQCCAGESLFFFLTL